MSKDDKIPDINKIDEIVEAIRDLEVLGRYSRSYGIGEARERTYRSALR